MLAMIVIPAVITLETVHQPAPLMPVDQTSTPHGYTFSLLLFIIPAGLIAVWFLPSEGLHIPRVLFFWTLTLLVPLGFLLDFVFAQWFFDYPNRGATLGILAPALGRWVPLEEYVFYFTGFLRRPSSVCLAWRVLAGGLQRDRLPWRSQESGSPVAISSHVIDFGRDSDWGRVVLQEAPGTSRRSRRISRLLHVPRRGSAVAGGDFLTLSRGGSSIGAP